MKGVGWIVILLGLLGVTYLLMRDVQAVRGERDGKAVIEPVERASEAMNKVRKLNTGTEEKLKKIDE